MSGRKQSRKATRSIAAPVAMKRSRHDKMVDDMTSALYKLSNQARPPEASSTERLLPKTLVQKPRRMVSAAKKHIERLHRQFVAAKRQTRKK